MWSFHFNNWLVCWEIQQTLLVLGNSETSGCSYWTYYVCKEPMYNQKLNMMLISAKQIKHPHKFCKHTNNTKHRLLSNKHAVWLFTEQPWKTLNQCFLQIMTFVEQLWKILNQCLLQLMMSQANLWYFLPMTGCQQFTQAATKWGYK